MPANNSGTPLFNLGHYELIERVGSGGMGSVYRGRDARSGQTVAIKLMHEVATSDPTYVERFRREAEVASMLHSPHVVRMLDFVSDGHRHFIVSEYVDGPSVEQLLTRGRMTPDQAASIASHVALALTEAQRHGVVHRDIKPGNILIAPDGTAKVADFGIAAMDASSSLTIPGLFIGTAAYAAPEQHRGRTDGRSDIYALGVVLFEMLAGHLPYQAETVTGMLRLHDEAPIPVSDLAGQPAQLVAVVERCLRKDPDERFAHASELLGYLNARPAPVAIVEPPTVAAVTRITSSGGVPDQTVFVDSGERTVVGEDERTGIVAAIAGPSLNEISARIGLGGLSPIWRAAAVGGVIAVLTLAAVLGFNSSSSEAHSSSPLAPGGTGRNPVVLVNDSAPIDGPITPTPSSTTPPKKRPVTPIIETTTPLPEAPTPDTVTPTPTPVTPVAPPTQPPPQPAPPKPPVAPSYSVIDYAFCHPNSCSSGNPNLYVGTSIAVGFQLNQPTSATVHIEAWFNGTRQYVTPFSPSGNGAYYEILPWANERGTLEIRVFVGGVQVGSFRTTVR